MPKATKPDRRTIEAVNHVLQVLQYAGVEITTYDIENIYKIVEADAVLYVTSWVANAHPEARAAYNKQLETEKGH